MAGEIFISYRRADAAWARLLYNQLRAEGVEAWYDALVGAGQDWRLATAKALEASQIFVLLFSENAAQSSDIAKELAAAVLEKKLIVPIRLQNTAPKGAFLYELASRNWIDAYDNTETKLAEVAKGLAHLVRTGARDESILPFDRASGGNASGSDKPKSAPSQRWLIAATGMVFALALGGLFWLYPKPATAPAKAAATRVAVLPFDALSGNTEVAIFAKAVAEQIIATLNDVQVQTVSREDATTLTGANRDAAAEKLGAGFILNGSIQGSGQNLRVTVHLDHAATHATVWTENYDQNGAAALEFQSQIAAIASDVVKQALSARRDDPAEMDDVALGIVLKMVAEKHNMTQEGLLGVRDLARQLSIHAPNYAWAHSALAVGTALLIGSAPPAEAAALRAEAKKSASQALALNPKNAEPYVALALLIPSGQWAEREAALRKGLAFAPNDATLQNYLAGTLADVGQLRDALALYTTSRMLDPLSPPKNATLAASLAGAGRVTEGISMINHAAETWPSNTTVWLTRLNLLANFGREDQATAMLDRVQDGPVSLEPRSIAAWRAYLQALRLDNPANKAAAATAIRSAMTSGDITAIQGMQMFAKLGDVDSAFALAAKLFASPASRQAPTGTAPLFQSATQSMRRDRRFMPMAAQAGLVDYWRSTGKWPDFCADPALPYDCRQEADKLKSVR